MFGAARLPGAEPNWHEFLDPNEEWEQTIYRNPANIARTVTIPTTSGRVVDHAATERIAAGALITTAANPRQQEEVTAVQ